MNFRNSLFTFGKLSDGGRLLEGPEMEKSEQRFAHIFTPNIITQNIITQNIITQNIITQNIIQVSFWLNIRQHLSNMSTLWLLYSSLSILLSETVGQLAIARSQFPGKTWLTANTIMNTQCAIVFFDFT